MYDNIGKKIKGLVKVLFIVESIAAAIVGIALLASDEDLIFTGLLVLLVGPIIAWVSSWLLYGFGELIDRVCEIAKNTSTSQNTPTVTANQKHYDHIENSEKIATTFKSSGIMDIPKRNK